MYDVIVVGARCAGAPTAMLLARKGYKVLLADRAVFPSEIPHGHFVHRHGPRRLQRWGVLDRLVAAGCPPVTSFTLDFEDFPLTGRNLVSDGIAFGYAPRRALLDQVLVEAAVEAGAELREGFSIHDLLTEAGRVTGIRGRGKASRTPVAEQATLTVGADGRNSRLAQLVGAPLYDVVPPLTCWYFSYWSGAPTNGLEVYVRQRRVIFAFPTSAGQMGVFVGWPAAELPAVRADIEGQLMAAVGLVPELAERVRRGRRAERFYGATDLPNFYRKPYGPGWALVGDAGAHKDPYLALGICDALRDAEYLVEAVDDGLSGRQPLEAALAGYEQKRNEASRTDYQENLAAAQFTPLPPNAAQLRAALRDNQADTDRFFMARQGMIPPESFFNPENLQRIMASALAEARV